MREKKKSFKSYCSIQFHVRSSCGTLQPMHTYSGKALKKSSVISESISDVRCQMPESFAFLIFFRGHV